VPELNGVLETSLYVADPDRSARFYRDLFGFDVVDAGPRLVALAVADRQLLLLFKKGASLALPRTPHDGEGQLHLAFAIPASELDAWADRLAAHGVEVVERRVWDRGGTSLYFRDPDGHCVELASPGIWPNY
jgi:catechol 2,3-dioxygenase-like lactoylglutathione lyase family enzyme